MKKSLAALLLSALIMSISSPSVAAGSRQTADAVRDIVRHYYVQSADLARGSEIGRVYTDHKLKHIEMVAEKSLEVGEAVRTAVLTGNLGSSSGEGRIAFTADIDEMTLEAAALSHDTGMNGGGYALEPAYGENGKQLKDEKGKKMFARNDDGSYLARPESDSDFDEVRSNHSLNSALNVLVNRELYREAGFTDEQIDKIAAECMAHSNSGSGVPNLNSREDWADSFDRIDSTVKAYSLDHPDAQIFFNRSSLEDDSALRWLDSVRDKSGITVNHIVFKDQHRRSEDGGGNVRLKAGAAYPEMEEALRSREADLISLNCEYEGRPVVIGVDLRIYNVYITIRKKTPADSAALEALLQLL